MKSGFCVEVGKNEKGTIKWILVPRFLAAIVCSVMSHDMNETDTKLVLFSILFL